MKNKENLEDKLRIVHQDDRFSPKIVKKTSPWKSYNKYNKYDETFPEQIIEIMKKSKNGKTDAQIAKELNCSKVTLMRWVEEIEEMREAYEICLMLRESKFDDLIENNMIADDLSDSLVERDNKMLDMYAKSNFDKFRDKVEKDKEDKNTEKEALSVISDLMKQFNSIKMQKDVNMIDLTPGNENET